LPLDFGDGGPIEVVPDVSADETFVEEYEQKRKKKRRRRRRKLHDREKWGRVSLSCQNPTEWVC
jgi:hypothetical protein